MCPPPPRQIGYNPIAILYHYVFVNSPPPPRQMVITFFVLLVISKQNNGVPPPPPPAKRNPGSTPGINKRNPIKFSEERIASEKQICSM